MNIEHLIKSLYIEESNEKYPYLDTKGIWTIGVGFTSVDGAPVTQDTQPLTSEETQRNLWAHIRTSRSVASSFVNNYDDLNSVRQLVLTNMAYQMGGRLFGFKKTKRYIEKRQWKRASVEMLDSKWSHQDSPNRARRMSQMFSSNRFLKYYGEIYEQNYSNRI